MTSPARALTIAGSDSGGGAGIQADLKTFVAHAVYGSSALTAVTAQNTRGVLAARLLDAELVRAQIEAVLTDIGADAVKIGMLGDRSVVEAVAAGLRGYSGPIVLDPVMVAKGGESLLDGPGVEALQDLLLPRATIVTPNLPELERLVGRTLEDREARSEAARRLAERGPAVLVKGGHAAGETVEDLLIGPDRSVSFSHPRSETRHTHGTGCTLSAAIAARLARGEDLVAAVEGAIDFVAAAIESAPGLGAGHGPVDHLFALRRGSIA